LIGETFKLTAEEKSRLTQFPVGEGLFFAGSNHVIMRILASQTEAELISTTPVQPPTNATTVLEANDPITTPGV
jgi:hypothetical protein